LHIHGLPAVRPAVDCIVMCV